LSSIGNVNPPPVRRRRTGWRVFAWVGSIAAVLLIGVLITGDILLHRAGPLLQQKVIDTLSTRFDSRVELATFRVSVVRGFEVYGTGLKLYPNNLPLNAPLISIDRFSFHVLNWKQLFVTPMYVNRVLVSGLSIHMPPKDQRANIPSFQQNHPSGAPPPSGQNGSPGIKILVGEILVDHADLLLENGKPGKLPLNFVIDKLDLHSVAAGRPLRFHATLVNPKPIGNIDSTGDFGPFDERSPGDTLVDGQYSFRHADLNTIKGIGGMLASTGEYHGQLDHIEVDGETTTPNFSLDMANRPLPLNTHFHAIVDGTNGDTYLQPVDAWLEKSHIVARGEVVRVAGVPGKDIHLTVTVDPGHIQDFLLLTVKNQPPLMTGDIQLHTEFDLPPGTGSVTERLRLKGAFSLANAVFTSDKIQSQVDELSLRGQGKPKQAAQAAAIEAATLQPGALGISSDMRGNFALGNHKLTLTALNYRVTGADIELSGLYDLQNQTLNFTGTARLNAHISQMVSGWKSWLLLPADPFFAKNGAGTQVPVKVGGTASHPDIGLDFHH
jgi:hypothetical protein